MDVEALRQIIKDAGGQTKFAARIGKTQGHVSQWLKRGKVPPAVALIIEKEMGVPRHELRPDIYPVPAPLHMDAAS